MTDVRDLLIHGIEKVTDHHRMLLASAKIKNDRGPYRNRSEESSGFWMTARRIPGREAA
jgi:hypothetical protein